MNSQQFSLRLLEARKITKVFGQGDSQVQVLKGIDFQVDSGQACVIVGASGSGKTTFLHILGGIEPPTSGQVLFNGVSWTDLSESEKARIRSTDFGFIFQYPYIIPELKVWENVALALRIQGWGFEVTRERALEWLERVGLKSKAEAWPTQLSGGQLQRVCLARALIHRPKVILADEPTGSLDSSTALQIQDLLFEYQKELGLALVVVTHDLNFAKRFQILWRLQDGLWEKVGTFHEG